MTKQELKQRRDDIYGLVGCHAYWDKVKAATAEKFKWLTDHAAELKDIDRQLEEITKQADKAKEDRRLPPDCPAKVMEWATHNLVTFPAAEAQTIAEVRGDWALVRTPGHKYWASLLEPSAYAQTRFAWWRTDETSVEQKKQRSCLGWAFFDGRYSKAEADQTFKTAKTLYAETKLKPN